SVGGLMRLSVMLSARANNRNPRQRENANGHPMMPAAQLPVESKAAHAALSARRTVIRRSDGSIVVAIAPAVLRVAIAVTLVLNAGTARDVLARHIADGAARDCADRTAD